MKRGNLFRIIAGSLVLASALLTKFHNPNWIYFTMFIGLNFIQSGITGFCLMLTILKKFGFRD